MNTRKPIGSAVIEVRSYPNATVVKTKNRRSIICENKDNADQCILVLKSLISKNVNLVNGKPLSVHESFTKGVLRAEIGMTTSSLQILHFLIGNHLRKINIDPLPLENTLE